MMIPERLSDNILLGRKCFHCGNYGLYKLRDGRLKCGHCKAKYSLAKLKKNLQILYFFYLELSARKASGELGIRYNTVHAQYMGYRRRIANYLDTQFVKLAGELEPDETYFGGKRKGKRCPGARNKG